MTSALKLEVKAIMTLLDSNTLVRGIVLNQKLLQEQETALMIYSLTDLNLSQPCVRCVRPFAIITLKVLDGELYDETLLQKSSSYYFLLNSQLDLNSL